MSSDPNDQTESLESPQSEATADFQPSAPGGATPGDTASIDPSASSPVPAGGSWPAAATDPTATWPPAPGEPAGDVTADCQPLTEDAAGDRTASWEPELDPLGATADFVPGEVSAPPTIDVPASSAGPPAALSGASGMGSRAPGTQHRRVADITMAASVGAFPPAAPQTRTDRYHLKKFHAKGGMGEIWLAEDGNMGRAVAYKKMRGKPRDDQKDQFLREAQITGQLEHPGVVPIHDLSIDDETGQPFYVMKFIQGRTLSEIIKEYHAPPRPGAAPREVQGLRLLQVFLKLCETIAYAHSRGVIHRDIKPDNVMVGAYGETLVLDWGLAKPVGVPEETDDPHGPIQVRFSFSGESVETLEGSVKGTPAYMAPEVAEGKVLEVDQASDIYLLGGTLYQILTGKKPREAKKILELIEEARKQPPVPPRKLDKTIPRPLEAICLKALASRKEDRYATAQAMAEDVQRYLAGEPVSAYRENLWERAWRWVKRHRVLLGRAAVLALVAGLVLFGIDQVQKIQAAYEKERIDNARKLEAARLARVEAERQQQLTENREKAKVDAAAFARLADDAQRLFALQQPGRDQLVGTGAEEAERKAAEAVTQLRGWGPTLADFPLAEKRDALKQQLYEVLLLQAETKSRRGTRAEAAKDTLALLDQAAALRTPTAAHHQLRADCYRLLGDKAEAEAARRATDPQTPWLALDHFLAGERRRGVHARDTQGREKQAWTPGQLNQFKLALDEYREAVKLDYQYFWGHFQLAQGYLSLNEEAKALAALDTCVAVRPKSPWGYMYRGFTRAMLKSLGNARITDALKDLDQAQALAPDLPQPKLYRALVNYEFAGKPETSLAEFTALLDMPPDKRLTEAAFYRGQLYLRLGQEDKALEDFSLVIKERPRGHPASRRRARIYFGRGDVRKGMDDLNAFLSLSAAFDPDAPEACAQRGRLMWLMARELPRQRQKAHLGLALDQINRAIKGGLKSYSVYDDLGAVLSGLRKTPEAVEAFTQAIRRAPKIAQAPLWRKLGVKLEELSRLKAAAAAFATAIELDPENAEGYAWLGYIQASLGQSPAAAMSKATQAVLLTPGDFMLLHNVACVYGKLAEKAYKSNDPKRAREYEDVALVLLRREVELWERDRSGMDAPAQIRIEPAFPQAMRDRPEFKELIKPRP
jgi:serine/threonine protein kinase/tetratricopeptide (TPR) repeat protein